MVKATAAEAIAAEISSEVDCGTRVTRLLVAGSHRSSHWVVSEGRKVFEIKFLVGIMGFLLSVGWWDVG